MQEVLMITLELSFQPHQERPPFPAPANTPHPFSQLFENIQKLFSNRSSLNSQLLQLKKLRLFLPPYRLNSELESHLDTMNKCAMQLEKFILDLWKLQKSELSAKRDFIPAVFEIEYQSRWLLEKDFEFEGKDQYRTYYKGSILPALSQAKKNIVKRPFYFSTLAAASKGEALQSALNLLTQKHPPLNFRDSAKPILLLPEYGTVLKKKCCKRMEEESITNSLFEILFPCSTTPNIAIQSLSHHKFGIRSSLKGSISFNDEDLFSAEMDQFKKRFSSFDLSILEYYKSKVASSSATANYQYIRKKVWFVQIAPDHSAKRMAFKEIQQHYLNNLLNEHSKVGLRHESLQPLLHHMGKNSPFFSALTYFPTLQPARFSIKADLSDSSRKTLYEQCQMHAWTYQDHRNQKHLIDFDHLFVQNLRREIKKISIPKPLERTLTGKELNRLLEGPLKLDPPDFLQINKTSQPSPFSRFISKPFIQDMFLLKELENYPGALDHAMNQLTTPSILRILLTGILQFLDLHYENIGFVFCSSAEYEQVKNLKFNMEKQIFTFRELFFQFFAGRIKVDDEISIEGESLSDRKKIKNWPELMQALHCKLELKLFDGDAALTESNELHFRHFLSTARREHAIPIRSAFLTTKWKDKPLTEGMIQWLTKIDDQAIKNWCQRKDAPLFHRLSAEAVEEILALLDPILRGYDHSQYRSMFPQNEITHQTLMNSFVQEICDLRNQESLPIWKIISKQLSQATIYEKDTLNKIAKRHHQSIATLKKLNQGFILRKGEKIKIDPPDLFFHEKSALLRRIAIARQLFPRVTIRAQEALFERVQKMKIYLSNYQKLVNSKSQGQTLLMELSNTLAHPENPLSSLEKNYFDQLLFKARLSPLTEERLSQLKTIILNKCRPTYFNLLKVMYPLLPNAYALNQRVYHFEDWGYQIGLFAHPIEDAIRRGYQKKRSEETEFCINKLKSQMSKVVNPAFFTVSS